ncbi:MAG: peroxide stress protein YaaA [Magnetococcales bacterium]|nr:peroxide stress protein YaaA [Magnetococcales bacterium]
MLSLISPAKKQLPPPSSTKIGHHPPRFPSQTKALMDILSPFDEKQLMDLMKISPKLAELNVERNQLFSFPHLPSNSCQAGVAFQGDTYVGLDSDSFTEEDWQFAQQHLAILSGLYGLLAPLDLVQPHRLEMGTRLNNAHGKSLYPFWGEVVTQEINTLLDNDPNHWVVNLASQEYFKVVLTAKLRPQLLTPVFKDNRGGKLKVIGIKAKKARGKMARFIIQNRLTSPDSLQSFAEDGYRFNPTLSNEREWVYVCDD